MQKLTFSKEERLHSKKKIDLLFAEGESFNLYPIRVIWRFLDSQNKEFPVEVLISVSKRKINKAVDRNLLKRRIKEAYRKNKPEFHTFLSNQSINCNLAFVYVASDIMLYNEIEQKIILILQRLQTEYEKSIG